MTDYQCFADAQAQLDTLYLMICQDLQQALDRQGRATLAVSGGRSPIPLFEKLSQAELDWANIYLTLVDDRWVERDHEASNEKLVLDHLLQNQAAKANFVGLKNSAATPFAGAAPAEAKLKQALPLPFDALILGMGEDGHTASLFPNSEQLADGLAMDSGKMLIGITPTMAPMIDRISLTLPAILSSRKIYLPISGANKIAVLQQARAGDDIYQMPIRAVLHQTQTPVTVLLTE